ncbi:MAG: hypothetical protein JKY56_07480 [Kofleriaceae bacterium]|nr:hypothetical protein [Kofleriaceae bacterium]
MMKKATYIPMQAIPGQSSSLQEFLTAGRDMVVENEPLTPHWYALKRQDEESAFAIFDLFPSQEGRAAHFAGKVAGALEENASVLVENGWHDGVVANIVNFETIATKIPDEATEVSKATFISLQAKPGQADKLAAFLKGGCELVIKGEPLTVYWMAMRSESDDHSFAIFDLFASEAGRVAHFEGKVAAALMAESDELLVGGWEDGVLANVVHFDVVAAK